MSDSREEAGVEVPKRPVLARQAPLRAETGTDTVVIACKIPQGIRMDYQQHVEESEGTPSGPHKIMVWRTVPGRSFRVAGPSSIVDPHIAAPMGRIMHPQLERFMTENGGYALTPGCPRDLWNQWYGFRKDEEIILNEMIKAFDTMENAQIWISTVGRDIRSGLEPVDPVRPELTTGTGTRNALGGVSTIQPATE